MPDLRTPVETWSLPDSELSTLPQPVLNENNIATDEPTDAPDLKRKLEPEPIQSTDALHACGSLLSQANSDEGNPPTQEDAGARASKRGRATQLFDLASPPLAQQPRHMPVLPEVEMLADTPTDKPKAPVNGWWHASEDKLNGAEVATPSTALSMYPRASPQLATYMTDDTPLQMPSITPMARAPGEPSRRPPTSHTPMMPAFNYSLLDSPFSLADMMDADELSFHHEHMLSVDAPEPLPQEVRAKIPKVSLRICRLCIQTPLTHFALCIPASPSSHHPSIVSVLGPSYHPPSTLSLIAQLTNGSNKVSRVRTGDFSTPVAGHAPAAVNGACAQHAGPPQGLRTQRPAAPPGGDATPQPPHRRADARGQLHARHGLVRLPHNNRRSSSVSAQAAPPPPVR